MAFLVGLIFSVSLLVFPTIATPLPPVADFTYTPEAPILGNVVVFDASASYDPDGTIESYRWDFGDSNIITVPDPVAHHNYTAIGTYNVTLTVTDNDSLTDTTWDTVTVRDYPVAYFTYSPATPIMGETVTFNASLSTPNGGTIVSYAWDFGDSNITVAGAVITHTYTAPENYTATLNVTDSEGLWDTESKSITVIDYPVAVFTYSPERPIVGETVTFNASLSTPNGGTITSYFWDFGDDTNETGITVTHVYTATGERTVTLNITDSEGLTDTAQDTFTVRDYPVAFFEYEPTLPLVDETVTFNASLSTSDGGTIVSYAWDFGDSNITVAGAVITHTYTAFGTYNVNLTITDSEDLTDTFLDTIRILIAPVASFTHSPAQPIFNETVVFDASASYDPDGSIESYRWDFGDSTIITVPDPVTHHKYIAEGTYNVTLTLTDDDGLTDTVWKLVTVYTFVYVHDVAITNVTTSANEVYLGQAVDITVVARNEGNSVETFNVTVYYGNTKVETKTVEYALPGNETTLMFSWNTTGVTPCNNYTIKANATIIGFVDANPANSEFINGQVKVKILRDVNGDGSVSVADMVLVDIALGSQPGEPYWNPQADVNFDGSASVADMVEIDIHLGETC